MNKENENATRRLDSENLYRSGDENMRSVSEASGSDESSASESQDETQGFLFHHSAAIATLSATFGATIIISLIASRMWDEDQIRLYSLDLMSRMCKAIALIFGSWALACERSYNEYVNALH